jgi:DNA polymerase-3 subunit beta
LIDGEYIEYDRVIISSHRIGVEVDRNALLSALDRAALITEERIAGSVRSHVKLQIEGDLLKIFANSTAGSTYDELPIEHEGDDLIIAFNNRYLIDSLRSCTADRVKISMTSALTSINIEPAEKEDDHSELFFLLPVRMKE